MPTTDRIGETLVRRWLDPQRRLSLAAGDFAPILRAYEEHVRRWELPTDGLSHAMMREGLSAFGLHLATRPASETLGITLNIHTPPLNIFLTGDAGERTLTGRAFTEDVQTATSSRLFVQAWVDAPATNFGWMLKGYESDTGTAKCFDSREAVDSALRPKLSVTFTVASPVEPTTWASVKELYRR